MIAGIILAGGRGRRMGGIDKPLVDIAGSSLLSRVIARLSPQVDAVVLNANGAAARFAGFGLPVVADSVADFAGPLAGVLAGLDWAAGQGMEHIVTVAADTPLFPADLVSRLRAAAAPLAIASSAGRTHPAFGWWPVAWAERLRRAVQVDRVRRLNGLTAAWGAVQVDWPDQPIDPFFNVNTPDDAARLADLLRL